jgi:hypothetical protein
LQTRDAVGRFQSVHRQSDQVNQIYLNRSISCLPVVKTALAADEVALFPRSERFATESDENHSRLFDDQARQVCSRSSTPTTPPNEINTRPPTRGRE